MAYNNRGGGNRFGGGGHGGNRRPPIQMHQATCSECKKSCEVPFRPSGDKPVFCSDCFKGKNNDSNRNDSRGPRRSYSDRDYSERPPKEMHEAVCSDCGKDCEVPFKPSGDKPIYCDKCFGKNKEIKSARHTGGGDSKLDEKLTMINIKLDRILKVLDAGAAGKTTQKKEPEGKSSDKKIDKTESSAEPTPEKSVVKKAKKKVKAKKAKV